MGCPQMTVDTPVCHSRPPSSGSQEWAVYQLSVNSQCMFGHYFAKRLSAISLTLAQYWIFALQRHSGQHLFVHILWSWKCWSSGDQLSVYWVSAVYLTIIFLEPKWACLWVNNSWGQRPNGLSTQRPIESERNNCFSKIQLVGKEYWDKTTLASKTQFSCHCFGFQSRRFSLLVGYNIRPSSGSINQNTANNW